MSDNYPSCVPAGVDVLKVGPIHYSQILTPDALAFVAKLHRTFNGRRLELLARRKARQADIDAGKLPDFLPETKSVREDPSWKVAPAPADLDDRRVEITGPVERKMLINALNSGAKVFMADFEDATSPAWNNLIDGHVNLRDAIERTISFAAPDGRQYKLNDQVATLVVRPRGWHLDERHMLVDKQPTSGSLFDFGLYMYHCAKRLLNRGSGPYFYLPKMESHLEARLWNDVFNLAQDELGLPRGTIRATVLIETVLAAFEMEEILYELRTHSAGLNAGRWDYLFSCIKKFRTRPGFFLPDRAQLTMTTPFMRAYTELLVRTCHKRGAHAIGGMAAFIPSRKDPKVNEVALAKVRDDKLRESGDGFDGTWVAHPDLVPVAMEVFNGVLKDQPHQKHRLREEVKVAGPQLIDFTVPGGQITEDGIRNSISVSLLYLEAWLRGQGCVPIYNLMEDAATAEISRSQLWQWVHNPAAKLADGRAIGVELYERLKGEELEKIRKLVGEAAYAGGKFAAAAELLDRLVKPAEYIEFLTLPAYELLD